MMKSSKIKFKLLVLFLFASVLKAEAKDFKEGMGTAYGVSKSSVIEHNGHKSYVSKGREQNFVTGAQISSLTGEVSLNFDKVLNVHLKPQTKMVINRFQFNEIKHFIEIFVQKGDAQFEIIDDEKVELTLRTPEGIMKAR